MPKLKRPAFLNRLNTKGNKRELLAIGIVLIIAISGFVSWSIFGDKIRDNKKVYAQAAGHKVYEPELRDFIGDHKEIKDHEAAQVLADKYLTEALAKEQGINVSDQELEAKYGTQINQQKSDFKYAYQSKVNELYFIKLQNKNRGIYKGKVLVAHFSHNIAFDSALKKEQKQYNPKLGNAAAIAKDKKYAQDLINRLHDEIESGKITFEKAISIERSDPVVGKKAYPTLSHSSPFDSTIISDGLISSDTARQQVQNMKTGEMSKPFVVKVQNSFEDENDMVESYFLVIKVDESVNGAGTDFKKHIDESKLRLEYGVYV